MRKISISHADCSFSGENRGHQTLKQPKLSRKIRRRVWNIRKYSRKRFINGIIRKMKSRRKSRKCSAASIKYFIKKVRLSLASDDDHVNEVVKKPVFGQESNQELLYESPFVLQDLESNANIMETEEFRTIQDIRPVASGVVVRGEFVQFSRGLLVNSGCPYYLPIVDNHGFLLGEFSKVDDLSICDNEDDSLPKFRLGPTP